MDGVNYKGRQVHVEVAETRSDGDSVQEERQERERKPRVDKKPEKREEKSRREEKPKKGKKSSREEKAYRDEKPFTKEKPGRGSKSSGKIDRHSAQRAPKVQIAQDEDFWRDIDDGDWRSFFRSDNGKPRRGAGRTENKPSKRKDNVKHKDSKKKKGSKRR